MPASYTYTTLKAAVIAFTEEQGTEFATAFDQILPLAESKILRDLDAEYFDTVNTLAFTASNPVLTKPTGTIATRSLHYTDASSNFVLLDPRSWEYVKDYWPKASTTTASPKYYAEYSATEWYVAGTPSGTNAVTARCVVNPAGLTSGNPNTWLSNYMGDLLFYACLAVSEQFLKADNRISMWLADYQQRLETARPVLRPARRIDYMPMTAIPSKEQ